MGVKTTPVHPLPVPTAWDLKLLERYDNGVRVRALMEMAVVRKLVQHAIEQGHTLSVNDGEDVPVKRSTDVDAIMDAAFAVDEAWLIVHKKVDDRTISASVYLVFGNSGYDVICDHSVSLEALLAPINEFAETLEAWV